MALSYYQLAADQGNPIAQEQLALYYLQHEQDPVKAATEARRLAENDHPKCAGIRVLQKMAESKVPEAQFQLAECFLYGAGVSESPSDAFFWFLQAAEQNHVEAQFMVGGFYLEGHGIHKDPNQAKRWLGIAAKSGHENAAEALSTIPGGPYAIGNCPRCGQKLKAGATRCWEGCNWPDPPPPAVRKDLICPKCRQPLGAGVSRCWTTGCDYIVR
jgi:TPR repeat protein